MHRLLRMLPVLGFVAYARADISSAQDDILAGNYDGTLASTQVVNYLAGAGALYNNGFFGQRTIIANIEGGYVWGQHEVFDRSGLGLPNSPELTFSDGSVTGQYDYHATMVGHVLAGTGYSNGGLTTLGAGMAPLATLWSGAIATSFDPVNIGSFSTTDASFLTPYKVAFQGSFGSKADVINSSWGFDDPAAISNENRVLDGLAAQNSSVTFVRAAGNGGPTAAPGVGYNGIVVGSLGGSSDAHPYLRPSTFSSSAAADFYNPATGQTITGVRAAVNIAAPGEQFALAAYLGDSGSLAGTPYVTSTPPTDQYFVFNQSGTSFASPVVAGGVSLLKDVSYVNFASQPNARDTRVIKSILMAGADATLGWDNDQHLANGILTTTQALDYVTGAGRVNVATSDAIYTTGTTDLPGNGGGLIASEGWDLGTVPLGGNNDYFFNLTFSTDTELSVSLNWFAGVSFDNSTGLGTPIDFANLDLQVWSVVNGVFTSEIAQSDSIYNNSEFLRFVVPAAGTYGLRVSFGSFVYDLTHSLTSEQYGIAWNTTTLAPVPESNAWGAAIGGVLAMLVWHRWRLSRRLKTS
jgi:hypothetical protein